MLTDFIAPANDPWGRVFEVLVEFSVAYDRDTPVPWRLGAPVRFGEKDRTARFRELEAAVVDEVEKGVELLIANRPIDELSDRAKYWLGVRVDACILFSSWLSKSAALLPAPTSSLEHLTRWILIDWWREHGPSLVTNLNDGGFPGHETDA